ncbi:MAG: hypothetical protein KDD61_16675, partial [Bdellovibrionales bacterium]|nr:hypothetical protein [Bdellovibrionales bacterium]
MIAQQLDTIIKMPKGYQGATLTMHLVKIHPDLVPVWDRPTPELNIFDEIYKENKEYFQAAILGPEPPFSVLALGGTHLTYRLDDLYVLNLNAYIDAYGNLVSDSDGDGLSDEQEASLGFDPLDPRSQSPCLDGFFHLHGCRSVSCDADYDRDGDSLNDCEEKTIQTNTKKIDSDSDNILDLHELLRGLNPNTDQRLTSSANDGYTDNQHFYMGLHPRTRVYQLNGVPPIEIEMTFVKYNSVRDESGNPAVTGVYRAVVNHIPIATTQKTKDFAIPRRYDDTRDKDRYVGPLPHDKNINQLLFVAKVAANEDPNDFYWLIHRQSIQKIDFPGSVIHMEIDFS